MTMKKSLIVMSNNTPQCEKCSNTEFFLVRIFRIWTEFEKIRTKKLRIWILFTQYQRL